MSRETIVSVQEELQGQIEELRNQLNEVIITMGKADKEFADTIQALVSTDKEWKDRALTSIETHSKALEGLATLVEALGKGKTATKKAAEIIYAPYTEQHPKKFDNTDSKKIWAAFLYIHKTLGDTLVVGYPKPKEGEAYPELGTLQLYVDNPKNPGHKLRVTCRSASLRAKAGDKNLSKLTAVYIEKTHKIDPKNATREQWFMSLVEVLKSPEGKAVLNASRRNKSNGR